MPSRAGPGAAGPGLWYHRDMVAPAHYFPVKPGPRRLTAGLMLLGTEFGNGPTDQRFFQIDDQYGRYLREKRAPGGEGRPRYHRHGWLTETRAQRRAHDAILAWMRETLAREHPERMPLARADEHYLSPYDALVRNLQEDAAVVLRTGPDTDALVMAHVCFPGSWRSDRVLGASFDAIHAPVPDFADQPAASASMVRAMVERGPYVRFVWSVCADDALDHHLDHGEHAAWSRAPGQGWLRVERQVSVPFPTVDASLFLIRTYIYALSTLAGDERRTLADALAHMPAEVRRYKRLEGHIPRILDILSRLEAG